MAKQPMQSNSLFDKDQYKLLITERRRLNELIATMDRAQQCGIDCTWYRQMRDEIDKQLEAIQTNFMTPAPQ